MTDTTLNPTTDAPDAPAPTEDEWRAAILDAEKARVIDVVVRRARDEGYCDETNYVLRAVYPDHEPYFYDSDGVDCHGYTRRQREQHRCSFCGQVHS